VKGVLTIVDVFRLSGMPFGKCHFGMLPTRICVMSLLFLNRNGSPILVTLVSFWHYAVVRRMPLTPNVAFTSVSFGEIELHCFLT